MKKFRDVFLTENNYLLEKCNTISDKVSANIKKEFDRNPVYNIYIFGKQYEFSWQ